MTPRVVDPPTQLESQPEGAASGELRDVGEDVREGLSSIKRAIEALSPRERVVFVMHYVAGLSPAEISEKLKISEGVSRSVLARARHRLQEELTASSGGSPIEEPHAKTVVKSDIRTIFLNRVWSYVQRVARQAPEAVLTRALEAETVEGTVAEAMSGLVLQEKELTEDDRILAAAIAEGARKKSSLLAKVGGGYTAEQLASLLKITPQAVHGGRQTNLYFGVPVARGYQFPKFQLTPSGLLTGLKDFLGAFSLPDPWTKLAVLVSPSPRLGGRSPLDAIKEGEIDQAVEVAATYGSHGA